MSPICIRTLAATIGGRFTFGLMPPLGGDLEPIQRLVPKAAMAGKGDVVLGQFGACGSELESQFCAEEAFAKGAIGVVSRWTTSPWDGCFSIQTDDLKSATIRLATAIRREQSKTVIMVLDERPNSPITADLLSRLGCSLQSHDETPVNLPASPLWRWLNSHISDECHVTTIGTNDDIRMLLDVIRPNIIVVDESAQHFTQLVSTTVGSSGYVIGRDGVTGQDDASLALAAYSLIRKKQAKRSCQLASA